MCPELKALFSGDTVFAGGQIASLRTIDFSIADLAASVQLLSHYEVDKLLPGHLCPVIRGGGAIANAAAEFAQGVNPRSIV
ncbi:hypothetical protein GCM10010911_06740 [Paenibacillus nasutitermitis]|uniref:MBL fold metallo-hydrolase n=1 Tax=Paenibacillus nasutitermitis TaxID=1652958 RepID=A0A917DNS9_9BACL|nr:hypothetical protein GCM10010911_06740 [Paenibacillus nasutitermitis]